MPHPLPLLSPPLPGRRRGPRAGHGLRHRRPAARRGPATGANVTGITINQHQINRAREITRGLSPWMQARCHFVKQDYLDIQGMEEGAYDAAFYMESSLHCEDRTKTFKETYMLLKPGGRIVAMEYNLLEGWNPNDPEQQELMRLHLHGNGAAKTPTIAEDLEMVRAAGFEVREHFDFANLGSEIHGKDNFPWWGDLQMNWGFKLLPAHPWVRRPLPDRLLRQDRPRARGRAQGRGAHERGRRRALGARQAQRHHAAVLRARHQARAKNKKIK